VLGMNFSDIADAEKVSTSTVKREVDNTLALIGLNRRSTSRGRPTGKKDSRTGAAKIIKQLGR
jgi:DNA-binding NarL/FixJ family response regulator